MPGTDQLLGRDREFAAIDGALDAAQNEMGACLAVRGEPGVGKTALLDSAAERARARGMTVLRATGIPLESHLPFAGLHQLLPVLRDDIPLLPEALRTSLTAAFEINGGTPPAFFGIAQAVLELLTHAASSAPLLVVVDDAQWLDRPTQQLLTFVARRLQCDPILMLLGIREGTKDDFEHAGLPTLEVGPLDTAAAASLLDAQAPGLPSAVRARVLDAAAGNPLALVELPKSISGSEAPSGLAAQLPLTSRLERTFAARLPDLPAPTRALLLTAAANDATDLAEALRATAIVTGARVPLDVVEPAIRARLVSVDGPRLRFRHPLVGSAVYQAATTAQRLAAHAALATVLADVPDRRAWHRAAATLAPDPDVATDLDQAAERARQRGAVMTAVVALQRAADFSVDDRLHADRLLRAGELACELGEVRIAADIGHRARDHVLGGPERGRLLLIEEMTEPGNFEDDARVRLLTEAGERAREAGDTDLAMALLWQAASRCWWGGAIPQTRELVTDAALRMGLRDEDPRLLAVLAYVAPEEHGRDTLDRLARVTVDRRDVVALRHIAGGAMVLGHFPLAASRFVECAAELRVQSRLGPLARTLISGCWPQVYVGRWDRVLADTDEGSRLAAETRQQMWTMGAAGNQGILAAMRGDRDTAETTAVAHQAIASTAGVRVQFALAQQIRGVAALAVGHYREAYDLLRLMFLPSERAFHYGVRCWAVGDLAEAAAHCGESAEARTLLAELEPLTTRTPSPFFHLGMRYARALLADETTAERRFGAAMSADLAAWPVDHGRLLLAYGSWLRRRRRTAESREPLRRAVSIFDALGALTWAERTREELRATGEVRRSRDLAARDELSPQELRIAQLAAEGLTNREIGQHLYLSHRTVGAHLYRLFPKLGITSRSQLAEVLAQLPGQVDSLA